MHQLFKISEIDGVIKVTCSIDNFSVAANWLFLNYGYNWEDLFYQDEEAEDEGYIIFQSRPTTLISKLKIV